MRGTRQVSLHFCSVHAWEIVKNWTISEQERRWRNRDASRRREGGTGAPRWTLGKSSKWCLFLLRQCSLFHQELAHPGLASVAQAAGEIRMHSAWRQWRTNKQLEGVWCWRSQRWGGEIRSSQGESSLTHTRSADSNHPLTFTLLCYNLMRRMKVNAAADHGSTWLDSNRTWFHDPRRCDC